MSRVAANQKSSLNLALDAVMTAGLKDLRVPGAVLLVARDSRILHEKAYGLAQAFAFGQEPLPCPEPMTIEHLFDLGSLTKVFATTFAIMLLLDEEVLGLDDPVKRYLPQFSESDKAAITIRSLLRHSSGLPAWLPVYYHCRNRHEALKFIAGLPLVRSIDCERCYSDLGFMVLAAISAEVSGQRLDAFLDERLYTPLGLRDTTFTRMVHGLTKIAATSHGNPFEQQMITDPSFGFPCSVRFADFSDWRQYTLKGEVNDANAFYCFGGVAGHAGLFSTASDLFILSTLLLKQGAYLGRRLFRSETITPFLTEDAFGNGLGWAMDPEVLHAPASLPAGSFGHTGFTGTSAVIIPQSKISIILLTNRQHGGLLPGGCYPDLKKLRQKIIATVITQLPS